MPPSDVLSRAARPPDLTLTYGGLPEQVADLWLPPVIAAGASGAAPAPLVLFLHGGFWRSAYDRRHIGPLAESLSAAGFAVCAPEYRRTGQSGGGWPGTFDDIRAAIATLPGTLADDEAIRVDALRPILAGHSAGGHLSLWAASTMDGSVRTVVSLGGICDLAGCYRLGLDDDATGALMGGGPDDFPDRYAVADPMALLPTGSIVTLIHGDLDQRVPWEQSRDYEVRAQEAGDVATCLLLPGVGHFELIDPLSAAWPTVLAAFRTAAEGLAELS